MIPAIHIDVQDTLTDALRRLVDSRENKDGMEAAINWAMQYWVSFIMAKQTVASRGSIKERLMARATNAKAASPVRRTGRGGRESTAKRYLQLRDTRAAAIVWAKNIENARHMSPENFFAYVGRWIAARQYSSGYHKSGFRPALNEFRIKRGYMGVVPFYKKPAGTAISAQNVSDGVMEAHVTNTTAGVEKNPTGSGAVELAKAEVVAKLERYIVENLMERADRLGVYRGYRGRHADGPRPF